MSENTLTAPAESCVARCKTETPTAFAPADIVETDTEFHIVMDVPGATKADTEVNLRDGLLSVTAKANLGREGCDCPVQYERSFRLGKTADQDTIAALLQDGVLQLSIGKAATAQARRIDVNDG